jgi:Uma2 family endonuclease
VGEAHRDTTARPRPLTDARRTMGNPRIRIGPADHGRRMRLADFEHAKVREGYVYELSRGTITVFDIPNRPHLLVLHAVRDQLCAYSLDHPEPHLLILAGCECKLLIPAFESERHPDVSVYLTEPPPIDDATLWRHWAPELVIEVVDPCSRRHDYEEKPDEYLRLGVSEYWIVDGPKQAIVAMQRERNRWVETVLGPPDLYQTPLLPGLLFSCKAALLSAGLTES